MVEPLLRQLLEVPLLEVTLVPQRQRKRKRKRVKLPTFAPYITFPAILTLHTEKEESDEDMGFGLFD